MIMMIVNCFDEDFGFLFQVVQCNVNRCRQDQTFELHTRYMHRLLQKLLKLENARKPPLHLRSNSWTIP